MLSNSKLFQIGTMSLILCLPGTALARQKHARYGRTMEDLRQAHALLQRTGGAQALDGAEDEVSLTIANIDGAMAEIEKEVGAEQKKPRALPRINPHMTWGDHLSQSMKMLEMAKLDCIREKNNSGDSGLQARVLNLLDQAQTRMTVAIQ